MPLDIGTRAASLDGDADRLVYFYLDSRGTFKLLDGDKIATLVAGYLQKLIKDSGLKLNLGLVQTAYANGSSTEYINKTLVGSFRLFHIFINSLKLTLFI